MPLLAAFGRQFLCAPLLVLATILGIGGFLWQSSLHQGMLDRLDGELQLVASALDYFQQTTPSDKLPTPASCEWAMAPLKQLTGDWLFARYSPSGDLICITVADHRSAIAMPDKLKTDQEAFFFTATRGETHRALLWPVTTNKTIGYQLLSTDLSDSTAQLLRCRLALLSASLLVLVAAAFYLRHSRRRQQCAGLNTLIRQIEDSGPDSPPQPLSADQLNSSQLRQLAESCYHLHQRMFAALDRARQFSAYVAHELRTPLTILRGETEIALRSKRETNDIRQVLESNLEEITRMGFLVDDLLTLSKSDLGEIPLQPGTINLRQLLTDLHRQGQTLAGEKEIVVQLSCPEEDTVFHADELRLRQALLNLLSNAIRYTPTRGVVSIAAEVTESAISLIISDTGIGIEDCHLQHIFERFYRVDKKVHQYDGGTGLGLAIVKWVVDAHHGTIDVYSAPEQGSRFVMTLPKNQNSPSNGLP